ncbi:sugar transferase [Cryomorpha ignava]|uniref:Sugar transferase n=1 Tax=Cryomorpha ignava TaxID=101383 RepID=A0A7K3WPA0_9FLAO|nr:sugar transferase [Cryomorpha ignava]NEN22565.1 sugar transferase [Cryomorpha ignava]
MLRSLFDKIAALLGLLVLSPFLIIIALAISIDSRGGVFFVQTRVGKDFKPFGLFKFRTMRPFAEKEGKLTIGNNDPRITTVGAILRKVKLDELPQLFNVLNGTMNLVGPRPEVLEYVEHYSEEQRKVLTVKPGITDYASLLYFNENEMLAQSENPKETYLNVIMPAKLKLNLEYIEKRSFSEDLKIIFRTVIRIFLIC